MKLAYVCYWDAWAEDGVNRKIAAQLGVWRRAGHDVRLFVLSPRGPAGSAPFADGEIVTFEGRRRFAPGRRLARAVATYAPDGLYLRYDAFPPAIWRVVRALPTIVEVNSDERRERGLRSGFGFARVYHGVNLRRIFGAARGFACVTRELTRTGAVAAAGKPTIAVANGLPDEIRPVPPAANARPRLVFLGSPGQPWHGVDKILWLAAALPEFDFDVVGPSAGYAPDAPRNLRLHGLLQEEDYRTIIAQADVGIGSLALDRVGLTEGSPLKVREYLLAGLPVVIGYEDTDFIGESPWFLLRLPGGDDNVRHSVDAIRSFVLAVRGKRVARGEVDDHIGIEAKEARRLEFIERVVASSGGRATEA